MARMHLVSSPASAKGLRMKCPRCWSDKAYVRRVKPWKRILLGCLFLVPMRCHHCYHNFAVLWFLTVGQVVEAPRLPISPLTRGSRPLAGRRRLAGPHAPEPLRSMHHRSDRRRADAA